MPLSLEQCLQYSQVEHALHLPVEEQVAHVWAFDSFITEKEIINSKLTPIKTARLLRFVFFIIVS